MDEVAGLLKLTIRQDGAQGKEDGPVQTCHSLDEHGWASLIQQCIEDELSSLTFLVSRARLLQKSSFFRSLLDGDFRESVEKHVSIIWDPATFCSLLQWICSGILHIPCNMECFLESILFFGVETAMVALIERMDEASFVKWALNLWNLAKGLGDFSVAEACVEAFAINFEDAVKQISFQNLPSGFLVACMEHKQLTVSSEQILCETVLNWFSCKQKTHANSIDTSPICDAHLSQFYSNEGAVDDGSQYKEKQFISSDKTICSIFQKVRILLLPVDIVLGTLGQVCPANMFHVNGTRLTTYDELFWYYEEVGQKTIQQLQAALGNDIALRITKYSKILDLTGCQQVTVHVLFQALLQTVLQNSSNDLTSYSRVEIEVYKILKAEISMFNSFDQEWCRKLALENLWEVNLKGCWRLEQSALAAWLYVVGPNLKRLDISHCPQLDFSILSQLSVSCESLENLKMSLYFKRCQPKSNILQAGSHYAKQTSIRHLNSIHIYGQLTCLTSLSLEGRSSLKDCDLEYLALCCTNLSAINIGGCFQLTDRGLAEFLGRLRSLTVLEAAYTAIGELSVNALLAGSGAAISQPSNILCSLQTWYGAYIEKCTLSTLDLEGCTSLDNNSISRLLKKAHFLKNLNLGFTRVDDSTLFSFDGTLLSKLNLRETEVTACGVTHILKWNQHLENLDIKGCKRLARALAFQDAEASQDDSIFRTDLQIQPSLKDLAVGWGFSDCTLRAWKSSLQSLQSISLGLGGRISEGVLCALAESSPQLQHLSLTCQIVSDTSLSSLLRNLPMLQKLELHHCLGEVTRELAGMIPTSLTTLCLERGVKWMTDGDVELQGSSCKGLTNISITGCMLLTSKSLHIMSESWRGMTNLVLQECGAMTSDGACCMFVCKALRQLTLRHSGSGLEKTFVERAHVELPLLQELCLDICDSKDGGFNSINAYKRRSLESLRLTRCTILRNSFNGFARRCYKDTIMIEWFDNKENSTVVDEGL